MTDPLSYGRIRSIRCPMRPAAERDAKIEQLLLAGLDQYFAGAVRPGDQRLDARAVLRSQPCARARVHRARAARASGAAARIRRAAAYRRAGVPQRRRRRGAAAAAGRARCRRAARTGVSHARTAQSARTDAGDARACAVDEGRHGRRGAGRCRFVSAASRVSGTDDRVSARRRRRVPRCDRADPIRLGICRRHVANARHAVRAGRA